MNIAEYAQFLRRRGYRVVQTNSCYWMQYRPFFYVAVPDFLPHRVGPTEVRAMLLSRAWAGLFFASPDGKVGRIADLCASGSGFGLASLESKARNQTRRGLERCKIAPISCQRLEHEGLDINRSALERQGRHSWHPDLTDQRRWSQRMRVCASTPDVTAWAALVEGEIASYAITVIVEGHAIIQSTMSRRRLLAHYPNNALLFTITKTLLEQGAEAVHYGFASDNARLVHFKQNMGFQARPIAYGVHINPILLPLVRRMRKFQHYFGTGVL